MKKSRQPSPFHPSAFILHPLFRFLMAGVLPATTTKLTEFQTLSRCLLVLGSRVVSTLALTTLKNDVIARHNLPLYVAALALGTLVTLT